jgi:hypothetical protein
VTCTDNGSYTATLTGDDGTAAPVGDTTTVTVNNVSPAAVTSSFTSALVGCPAPSATTNATLAGSWTDPGADTWTVDIDWDYTGSFVADKTLTGLTTRSFTTSTLFSNGTHTAAVRVTDDDSGQSPIVVATNTFTVGYTMGGLLSPFNSDGSSVWKAGSTVPVKVRITDCAGKPVPGLAPTVGTRLDSSSDPASGIDEATSTSNADSGNTMRYDAGAGQYIFNFASSTLTDPSAIYYMNVRLPNAIGQTPAGAPANGQSWQKFGLKKK